MTEPIQASLRVRVGSEDAHYGTIAAGAFVMQLFGDLATEITVRRDGDEGLLRAYESVEFLAPVRPGDFLECRATLVRQGRTSRTFEAEAWKVITTRQDLTEVLQLAAEGKLRCLIETQPLEAINDIFDAMRAGKITGRVVLTF